MRTCPVFWLFLFFAVFHTAFAQWQPVGSGTTKNLVDGFFLNDSAGFLISSDGFVLKTADRGTTWTHIASLTGVFTTICNTGNDTFYAGGNAIYRSSDGGNSWTLVSGLNDTISDMIFFGAKTGFSIVPGYTSCIWAGTTFPLDDYKVYQTNDYGASWQPAFYISESTSRFRKINDSVAYIPGGQCMNYPHCCNGYENLSKRTHDRGLTWNVAWQHPVGHSYCSFIDADTGYFISRHDRSGIYKTGDGAASLTAYYAEIPGNIIKDCRFMNQIDAYLLADNTIYVSTSEGVAWTSDFVSGITLNKLIYLKDSALFCIGSQGTILKKQIVFSPHPDSVYRMKLSSGQVDFGLVSLNSTTIRDFKVTNTGNTLLQLSVDAPEDFLIGLTPSLFTNTLTLSLLRAEKRDIFIRFNPRHEGNYTGAIAISGQHVENQYIQVQGTADAILYGNIVKDTLICKDTLRVGSDITIEAGATLKLCPGMIVLFTGNYGITVKGSLDARGDSAAPITFNATGLSNAWTGIRLQHAMQDDTSFFSHCNIDMTTWQHMLFVDNSRVKIDHCNLSNRNSNHDAIHVEGPDAIMEMAYCNLYNIGRCAVAGNNPARCRLTNCTVHDNSSAIAIDYASSAGLHVPVVILENNSIYSNNGGVFLGGNTRVSGNRIFNNDDGLRIMLGRDSILIQNNEVFNNGNFTNPAGITLDYPLCDAYIIQNLVYNNSNLQSNGGGIYINNTAVYQDTIFITGNTVCNNLVAEGYLGSQLYVTGHCRLRDNIIWNVSDTGNNLAFYKDQDADLDYNCLVQKGLKNPGPHNIYSDPLFARPTLIPGCLAGGTPAPDWSLTPKSPCINQGDPIIYPFIPSMDFSGKPRIRHDRIDMGAYEYQGNLSTPEFQTAKDHRVFPVPARDILMVIVAREEPVEIRLFDIFSELMITQSFVHSTVIHLAHFSSGIYLYEIWCNHRCVGRGKVVKV